MSEKSFLERRGIRPLKSLVVNAPEVELSFNLPGMPYVEPRFANVTLNAETDDGGPKHPWGKGLIGVAYYITLEDMAQIFRTEGGGSSYQIIQVDCYEIGGTGQKVRANTLFANDKRRLRNQLGQPSARYMNLLRTGAKEKSLPKEYQDYLENVETYHRTNRLQIFGLVILGSVLLPVFLLGVLVGRLLQNKKGESPRWIQRIKQTIFRGGWAIHDAVLKPLFGSGEVTEHR
ncbi:hypothetical protein FRC20_003396 [Serendipita sp. 405]|nr:hypothetical protein FRC20_003396 [Serendipita sp. 405]